MERLRGERVELAKAAVWMQKVRERLERNGGILTPADIHDIERELHEQLFVVSEEAHRVERLAAWQLAARRTIPLTLTIIIGLGVAGIIQGFEAVLRKHPLLVAFAPLVSAVSGNFGLQTATVVIRALATMTFSNTLRILLRESLVGLLCSIVVGTIAGWLAWLTTGHWEAFLVLYASLSVGILVAAVMGTIIPLFFHRVGIDPALVAGPFETSFQDLASYTAFLAATWVFLEGMKQI